MKRFFSISTVLLLLTFFLAFQSDTNQRGVITKNVNIFARILRDLDQMYVDTVNPNALAYTAIQAMLKELDPYTVYYDEKNLYQVDLLTKGQYAGIGALLSAKKGGTVVRQVYPNTPASRGGLRPGDLIVTIDGKDVRGWDSRRVTDLLKGKPQEKVLVGLSRPGEVQEISVELTREVIQQPVVPVAKVMGGGVGYLLLTSFTDKAAPEFKVALDNLLAKGIKSLVIDLRNNGGGRMDHAISICSYFLPKGSKVVEMRGKDKQDVKSFFTESEPIAPSLPLAVLVNGNTASAAEIVSGALQDYDRAVVVGTNSFGKGLVQTVKPLPYKTKMKLTTAKYYIPSGRCVQAIHYSHKGDSLSTSTTPDSLLRPFKTMAGRRVLEGSGIMPDVKEELRELSSIGMEIIKSDLVFDFVTQYRLKHPTIAPASTFKVSDALFAEFKTFVKSKDFDYSTKTQSAMKKLIESAKSEGYYKKNKTSFDQLDRLLKHNVSADMDLAKEDIKDLLGAELISCYYGPVGMMDYRTYIDPQILKAKSLLQDPKKIAQLLVAPTK